MKYWVLVLAILLTSCIDDDVSGPIAMIYYVPISWAVHPDVTVDNISTQYIASAALKESSRSVKKLRDLLSRAKNGATFDHNNVRVKLQFSDQEVVYVDDHGAVLRPNFVGQLDSESLHEMKRLLEKITERRLRHQKDEQ